MEKASVLVQAHARGRSQRVLLAKEREIEHSRAASIQARYRGAKERAAHSDAAVRRERNLRDQQLQSRNYLARHKIQQLMEMLVQHAVHHRPDDLRAFLAAKLAELRTTPEPTAPTNFFAEDEIETLYNMYDISKRGMTPEQCREALLAIGAADGAAVPTSGPIDVSTFAGLCRAASR